MKARILDPAKQNQTIKWDKFAQAHPLANIHQSSVWAHFQSQIPSRGKYWIAVLEEGGTIVGGTVIIRQSLPKGHCWLYAPRGPLLNYANKIELNDQMKALLKAIRPIAKEENATFLRIDPPTECHKPPRLRQFHHVSHGFQPEHSLILELKHPQQEILDQMKPKGRYNIRLAERKGVTIREIDPKNVATFNLDMESFYDVLTQTTERDDFSSHDKDFYRIMLETLIPTKSATLYLAEYRKKIIAGIIVTQYKDTATYYFGASSDEDRNVMAPYLLHWHAIKAAKHRKQSYYDFFGIAPEGAKNHPWAGVTQFKLKFGGRRICHPPAQEYAFRPFLYFLYRLYKKFHR